MSPLSATRRPEGPPWWMSLLGRPHPAKKDRGDVALPWALISQPAYINSLLPTEKCINPKFHSFALSRKHLCWKSQPERIATLGGKAGGFEGSRGYKRTPEILRRAGVSPWIDWSGAWSRHRGKEGVARVLGGPDGCFTLASLLCANQWRWMFLPIFTSYLYFSLHINCHLI